MSIKASKRLNGVSEYYFANKLREVRQLQESGKPVLNLGVGSPDMGPRENVIAVLNDPDTEILPLMGSKEGLMHITMAFTNPGERVLIPDPGYLAYESVARLLELEIVKYDLKPENNWQPDIEQLNKI